MLQSPTRLQSSDEQKRRRELELAALILLMSGALNRYARNFVAGALTYDMFVHYAMALIRQSHRQAAQIGAAKAGAVTSNAYAVAQRAATQQEDFLAAFARDMANGRYDPKRDGGEGAAARAARFKLYALRLEGTANAAWLSVVQAQGEDVLWVLGDAEHCDVCPVLAAHGWWKPGTLHQVPRDCQTPCLVHCKCRLVTRSGEYA